METLSHLAPDGSVLTHQEINQLVAKAFPAGDYAGKKILLVVPDSTRTAPVGTIFKAIHEQIGATSAALDVIVALGTHSAMSEEAILQRLEISAGEKASVYKRVRLFNHEWDNPEALATVGTIPASDIHTLSGGLFAMDVTVQINRRIFDYDQLVIIGPVFPHEVVGFSGGNKYLFPGIGGPEILNFFHWLGAVVTNPMIIGNKWTPVRKVVDRAAAMVTVDKRCCAIVVERGEAAGLFIGTPEDAWDQASELSRKLHITTRKKPFHTILSCAPKMYDEIWTAGKCMYKLEPVVADGGELIIYAPHIDEVSFTHGEWITKVGYHCRDYFLKQWDRFKDVPWGILAHSTHVRGIGSFENGVEQCRVKVTLATRIPREVCESINLGWRDPDSIDVESFANREEEGVLLVRKAGELLYQLETPAPWAAGSPA